MNNQLSELPPPVSTPPNSVTCSAAKQLQKGVPSPSGPFKFKCTFCLEIFDEVSLIHEHHDRFHNHEVFKMEVQVSGGTEAEASSQEHDLSKDKGERDGDHKDVHATSAQHNEIQSVADTAPISTQVGQTDEVSDGHTIDDVATPTIDNHNGFINNGRRRALRKLKSMKSISRSRKVNRRGSKREHQFRCLHCQKLFLSQWSLTQHVSTLIN